MRVPLDKVVDFQRSLNSDTLFQPGGEQIGWYVKKLSLKLITVLCALRISPLRIHGAWHPGEKPAINSKDLF